MLPLGRKLNRWQWKSLLLLQMCLTSVSFHRPLGTTFKGKYGCVDYWVKAFLERPSFPTQEIKKRFEVMDPVDVNTPELLVSAALLWKAWVSAGVGREKSF